MTTKEQTVKKRDHPLYDRWVGMKRRCFDPRHIKYDAYGGRGITVCAEWLDFQTFVDDVGPVPCEINRRWTLDRIDNDGNYEPGNVRWALDSEQNRNRRSYTLPSRHRETCDKGHNDFKDYGAGRVCRPCFNEKQRARRAAKRQAVSA